jgi:hypothetical protein
MASTSPLFARNVSARPDREKKEKKKEKKEEKVRACPHCRLPHGLYTGRHSTTRP